MAKMFSDSSIFSKNSTRDSISDDYLEKCPNIPDKSAGHQHAITAFLFGPVKPDNADLALLACCFVTGMVDAASFANWSVFTGMQSGNTVILGLSVAVLPRNPYAYVDTLVSLASFLVGCFVTFKLGYHFTPMGFYSKRVVIVSLFLAQGLLILLSAGLSTDPKLVPQVPPSTGARSTAPAQIITKIQSVALLPPLAVQSGIQITCSRLMDLDYLPVNVLTSLYCDLFADPKLFALNNVRRNRRVAAAILLLLGSIVAAWLIRSPGGLQSVLWIAAGIKILVPVVLLCFLPATNSGEISEDCCPERISEEKQKHESG